MQKQLERLNKAREEKERIKKMTTRGIPKVNNANRRPLVSSEAQDTVGEQPSGLTEVGALGESPNPGAQSQTTFKSFH